MLKCTPHEHELCRLLIFQTKAVIQSVLALSRGLSFNVLFAQVSDQNLASYFELYLTQ